MKIAKNILLVSHYTPIPGPVDKWSLYLDKKGFLVTRFYNPLYPRSQQKSRIINENKTIEYKIPWPFQFTLEGFVMAVIYCLKTKYQKEFDLAICFDPLAFWHTYFLKRFLSIHKIIYFNVDFSAQRFSNILMDSIYQKTNLFAYKKSDYFFSITKTFIDKIDPKNEYKTKDKVFIMKHTIDMNIKRKEKTKKNNSIAFVGTLDGYTNFDDLIQALKLLKRDGVQFLFDIYGYGDQEEILKTKIQDSALVKEVKFKGLVGHDKLIKFILTKYRIGVCPYVDKFNNSGSDYLYNATDLTTKIVDYIGSGLPVISTKISPAFEVIEKNKFGFLVKNTREWYEVLRKLLTDKNLYRQYHLNAINFAKKHYDEDKFIGPIIEKVLT